MIILSLRQEKTSYFFLLNLYRKCQFFREPIEAVNGQDEHSFLPVFADRSFKGDFHFGEIPLDNCILDKDCGTNCRKLCIIC